MGRKAEQRQQSLHDRAAAQYETDVHDLITRKSRMHGVYPSFFEEVLGSRGVVHFALNTGKGRKHLGWDVTATAGTIVSDRLAAMNGVSGDQVVGQWWGNLAISRATLVAPKQAALTGVYVNRSDESTAVNGVDLGSFMTADDIEFKFGIDRAAAEAEIMTGTSWLTVSREGLQRMGQLALPDGYLHPAMSQLDEALFGQR